MWSQDLVPLLSLQVISEMLPNISMPQFLCYKNDMYVTGLLQRLKGIIYTQALYKVQPVYTCVACLWNTGNVCTVMETLFQSLFLLPSLGLYEQGPPGKGKWC